MTPEKTGDAIAGFTQVFITFSRFTLSRFTHMANEFKIFAEITTTIYAVLLNPQGEAWLGTAFEPIVADDWRSYAMPLDRQDETFVYLGSMPSAVTESGWYTYLVFQQISDNPDPTDTCLGVGTI